MDRGIEIPQETLQQLAGITPPTIFHTSSEGWFFNVANSGAVRLKLEGGKTFFVGSNEPKKLAQALMTND